MNTKQKIIIGVIAIIIVGGGFYFFSNSKKVTKQINLDNSQSQNYPIANDGPVSPISGLACDNWNRRPVAVMQPADPTARPAAGFSDADMVFELPVFTNSNTRLMGVYLCNVPNEIGSIRSARHDYMALAGGLDAVFVHWGYSKFAQSLLEKKILDNIDCLTTSYCARWQKTGVMQLEDTGHITKDNIEKAISTYGYHTDDKFSGYPHQGEAPLDQRPNGGSLRVAYPKKYGVSYDYDKVTNTYLRIWDGTQDVDKNNGQKVAPKNIVVMVANDKQITLADEQSYKDAGLMDPWSLVPADDQKGLDYGGVGRYNNLQIGDPWFDTEDSGEAFFYFNGQQYHGTWKKDKSKLDSKLFFYNDDGSEVKFVPGQIWVDVKEPDQGMRWSPGI
jgi:hypothetical protein